MLCHALTVAVGVVLLWFSAGETVLSGDTGVAVLAFAVGAGLHACSCLLTARSTATGRPAAATAVTAAALTLGVVATTGAFLLTDLYFLGWLAAFTAALVTAASVVGLLADLLTTSLVRPLLQAASAMAGCAGIVLTQPIWSDNGLLGGLLVFTGGLVACGRLVQLVVHVASSRAAVAVPLRSHHSMSRHATSDSLAKETHP